MLTALNKTVLCIVLVLWVVIGPTSARAQASKNCQTSYGKTKRARVPTTTLTSTATSTKVLTYTTTPTTTVVPSPVTTTLIRTVRTTTTTSRPQYTYSVSIFDTQFETTLRETTNTYTLSRTSTLLVTITPVTTEYPPAGFTPLSVQLVKAGYMPSMKAKKRHAQVEEDEVPEGHIWRGRAVKKYPTKVICKKNVQITKTITTTVKAKGTQTKTANAATVTRTGSTVVETVSKTVTIDPTETTYYFSTTSTVYETYTWSTTKITTRTVTSTTSAATSTYYAACGLNNQVGHVNDGEINAIYQVSAPGLQDIGIFNNTYGCCVKCLQIANCGGSSWDTSTGGCTILTTHVDACFPSVAAGSFSTDSDGPPGDGFINSNSYCGRWAYYGGS